MDDLNFYEYTRVDDEENFDEGQVRLLQYSTNINDNWVDTNKSLGNFGTIKFYRDKVELSILPISKSTKITKYTSISVTSNRKQDDPYFSEKNLLVTVEFNNKELGQWWKIKFEARPEKAREIYNEIETFISSHSKACFVATTVYGDVNCAQVEKLREWRDTKLKDHILGKKFIEFYYKNGERWAKIISHRPVLKKTIKFGLDIFTKLLK